MKKILAVALLLVVGSAFASTTQIDVTKKDTLKNPSTDWAINHASDTITFTNLNAYDINVQVSVAPSTYYIDGERIPDDATITCNGKDYIVKSASSIVCPVSNISPLIIKDSNFKNGTNGIYAVLN